jgi:hypothetical protein
MSTAIEYADVGLPPFDAAPAPPTIAPEEHERRMAGLVAAAEADRVVVYGDREHPGNMTFLSWTGRTGRTRPSGAGRTI